MIELLPGGFDSRFLRFIETKVKAMREDAAQSDRRDDGGAYLLETKAACWIAGLQNRMPPSLQSVYDEFQHQNDPEYKEYLRLKDKFKK